LASQANPPEWTQALQREPQPPLANRADEIACQIGEVLVADGTLTIGDVRAAIDAVSGKQTACRVLMGVSDTSP
jgi:hypothetical protein